MTEPNRPENHTGTNGNASNMLWIFRQILVNTMRRTRLAQSSVQPIRVAEPKVASGEAQFLPPITTLPSSCFAEDESNGTASRSMVYTLLGSRRTLYIVALLYAAYRFYGLLAYPYWVDEFYTASVAGLKWSGLFRQVAAEVVHLPGFYLILKVWRYLVGDSLLLLRALPFLLSLALFPFLRRLVCGFRRSPQAQNLCLFLFAFNPVLCHHSFFIRMYGLLLVLAILSLLFFRRWLGSGALM